MTARVISIATEAATIQTAFGVVDSLLLSFGGPERL